MDVNKMGKPYRMLCWLARRVGPCRPLMEDHRTDSLGLLALVLQVAVLDGGSGLFHVYFSAKSVTDTNTKVGH